MITLTLLAEFADATTKEEALAKLDAFREAVVPSQHYGITLYQPDRLIEAELVVCSDDEQVLVCPHCRTADEFSYWEDISHRRSYNGMRRIGDGWFLRIEGFYAGDGDSENPRLFCDHCCKECRIPDAVEVEFT